MLAGCTRRAISALRFRAKGLAEPGNARPFRRVDMLRPTATFVTEDTPKHCYVRRRGSAGSGVAKAKKHQTVRRPPPGKAKAARRAQIGGRNRGGKKAPGKPKKRQPRPKSARKPADRTPGARFAVRALDPTRKCGTGTSVQLMYRVDEAGENGVRTHLVFFDRHGWYCEHGRDCPAVAPARRLGDRGRNGPDFNGRMRA